VHAITLLKHVVVVVVVLSKSEGPQKWLAPFGTDVHRVAHTFDVCIPEHESHRHTKMMKWGTKRTKHGEIGRNICLLT
jgi:hypothetical protein